MLKGELEQLSKEDMRERLVVAEMVMKKLFQRNKDLEDQIEGDRLLSKTEVKSHTNLVTPRDESFDVSHHELSSVR